MANAAALASGLTEEQWAAFNRDGFLRLGAVASAEELAALNARLVDIMLGHIQYGEKLLMQLDPNAPMLAGAGGGPAPAAAATGGAGAAPGALSAAAEAAAYAATNTEVSGQTAGFKGASLAYRKVGEAEAGLECDPVFLSFMQKPLFRAICDRVYGGHAAIAVYRAMVMSKPSGDNGGGTPLPWHQDGGDWWALDRDPLCFVWMALTPATRENGAVQVVRGSHKAGLLSRRGHTLSLEAIDAIVGAHPEDVVDVELAPGEAFLCHNFTVHRSGVNATPVARAGFSVNYIDARTRVLDPKPALAGSLGTPGGAFPLVFPSPFAA
jgi:hypothetical protein